MNNQYQDMARDFIAKCNKLAKNFEGLSKSDLSVELTKLQKTVSADEYEFILYALTIGMSIGLTSELQQAEV